MVSHISEQIKDTELVMVAQFIYVIDILATIWIIKEDRKKK